MKGGKGRRKGRHASTIYVSKGSSKKPKVYFRPKEPKELIKSEFFHE